MNTSSAEKIRRHQYLITRAGKGSFALGVLLLIFMPIFILFNDNEYAYSLPIIIATAIFLIWLGKSIEKSNKYLMPKLIALMVSCLVLVGGIIPIIVLVQALVAMNSLSKLKQLGDDALETRLNTINHNEQNSALRQQDSQVHKENTEIHAEFEYDEYSRAKIDIIRLGFKKINHLTITDRDMEKLPEKEIKRYYKIGIKELKK